MDYLNNGLNQWNLVLTDTQVQQFHKYKELLVSWNEKMNLTAVTEDKEIQIKHFLDSLSICRVLDPMRYGSLLDLGTGAGFPGIPIKIIWPYIQITLADSLKKRVRFLDEVIRELELDGITAVHGRAEELAKDGNHREQYDLCVSRAVANLSTLSEYCLPFVKKGGYFVSYKGSDASEECKNAKKAIRLLGGRIEKEESFTLPLSEYGRTLIAVKKTDPTPGKYPRRAGTPAKEPL